MIWSVWMDYWYIDVQEWASRLLFWFFLGAAVSAGGLALLLAQFGDDDDRR